MERVDREIFEKWAEANEHASGVKVNSRIVGNDFITEYASSYDGSLLAKCVSSDSGEIYFMGMQHGC